MRRASTSNARSLRSSVKLTECCFITIRVLEYLHAQMVLEMCGGNRAKAAKVLGIERTALRRYLGRSGLRKEAHSTGAAGRCSQPAATKNNFPAGRSSDVKKRPQLGHFK